MKTLRELLDEQFPYGVGSSSSWEKSASEAVRAGKEERAAQGLPTTPLSSSMETDSLRRYFDKEKEKGVLEVRNCDVNITKSEG